MEKRRSEVDRRLDSLINQSTRALRQVNRNTVLKLLRLFNLCDLGTNSADKDKAKQACGSPRRGIRARIVQNAVDQSQVRFCQILAHVSRRQQSVVALLCNAFQAFLCAAVCLCCNRPSLTLHIFCCFLQKSAQSVLGAVCLCWPNWKSITC